MAEDDLRSWSGPLADVQVVDLTTGIAGPYCTKLFADAGAEVVKVELAGGDPIRRRRPSGVEVEDGDSPLFQHLNGGKLSVIGSVDDPGIAELLAGADVLVEDGLDDERLREIRQCHPHLVVVSITPYGRTGPLSGAPASDLTVQAESGAMKFRGRPDRPPVRAGGRISEFLAGAAAAGPALAAVLRSRRDGVGEHVDVSMHEVMAIAGSNYMDLLDALMHRPPVERPLRLLDTPGIEQTSDGFVGLNANTGRMFEMFLLMIERPDLMDDPQIARLYHRIAMGEEWQQIIDAWMPHHTTQEVVDAAAELRIPVAPVHDGKSVLEDEQYTARGVFEGTDTEGLRIRAPYLVDGVRPPLRPAPALDEHRGRVRPRPPRVAPDPAAAPRLPLEGVRVVDQTSWWVGGLATQVLALLGADVVHVESTAHPDGMRLTGAWSGSPQWWEYGHMFTACNAGKRGVTLDLGQPDGARLLRELIAEADVYVENFSPRVTESFGLSFDEVRALNPSIVHLRMPAFGLTGPWRDRPAFAQVIEPMSTMASITGYPQDRPVSKGGLPDPTAGWHGAFVALLGLAQREATGEGVALEAVMAEAALNVCPEPALEWAHHGHLMGRSGNRSDDALFQAVVPCRGPDEWLAVTAVDERQVASLLEAAGRPFGTGAIPGHDEIESIVASWAHDRDADDAAAALRAAGVPAGRCHDPRKLVEHPQLAARRLYEDLDHPLLGRHQAPGLPCRFSSVDRWLSCAAPTLGQHNREVLPIDDTEADRLESLGVIGTTPNGL